MKLQALLIRWILNPLGALMEGIPGRHRTVGFYLGGVGLFALYFLHGAGYGPARYLLMFAAGCLCLGLMILCVLPADMRPMHFAPALSVCWLGAGGFMLLSGILRNTDNLSDAIMFLLAYPVIWLVWSQYGIEKIFRMLSRLAIGSFPVFFVVSLCFFPITESQYASFFNNVNTTSMYLTVVLCCLLTELFRTEKIKRTAVLYWVLTGMVCAMIFYTNSRTGELSVLMAFFFGVCLKLLRDRQNAGRFLLRCVLPIVVSVVLFIPTTVYAFRAAESVRTSIAVSAEGSNASLPPDEQIPHGIRGFIEKNEVKTDIEGKSLNNISTGRIAIWQVFSKHISLLGTDEPTQYYVADRDRVYSTAHNTPLQYAVRCGLFSAVFYTLFNLLAGLKSVRFAVKERLDGYEWMPFLVTMVMGVTSMLEAVNEPYSYMISMYYFFVQAPLMVSSKKGAQGVSSIEKGVRI